MSLTYTTDVFCDGVGCLQWVDGVTGRPNAKGARREALRAGWVHSNGLDLCPDCQLGQGPGRIDPWRPGSGASVGDE